MRPKRSPNKRIWGIEEFKKEPKPGKLTKEESIVRLRGFNPHLRRVFVVMGNWEA